MGDEKKEPPTQETNVLKYFLAGGFGGVCTVVSGHPFDTIKVRMQTQSVGPDGKPQYSGPMECARQTLKNEGPTGFYKGMTAPLLVVAPIFAINFFSYGLGRKLIQKDTSLPLTPVEIYLAGAFGGFCTAVIMAPGERVKCLLQIQKTGPKLYDGPFDCLKKLYKTGGIPSIFKGICATLLRDIPSGGMYFLTYEMIQRAFANESGHVGLGSTILAGGSAGMSFWVIGIPFDTVKSRVQTAPEGTYPRGVRDAFVKLMKTEGPSALFTGLGPVMLRSFPANAACFVGFEIAMYVMNKIY